MKILVVLCGEWPIQSLTHYYDHAFTRFQKQESNEILLISRLNWDWFDISDSQAKFYHDKWWNYFIWNDQQIYSYIISLLKTYEKFYFTTFNEFDIIFSSELKKLVGQKISDFNEMYNSKELQRKLLNEHSSDLWVLTKKYKSINELQFHALSKEFWLPFIVKPSRWASSSWVIKVNDESEFESWVQILQSSLDKLWVRGYNDLEILVEEFIDWQLFTLDYYVNECDEIFFTWPVKSYTADDEYGNWDFPVVREYVDTDFRWESDFGIKLDRFICDTVIACGIRNTFIHHEFKLTKSWLLKTIEINWRIWWFRLMMYDLYFWVNLLEMMLTSNKFIIDSSKQVSLYLLFPIKEWIYIWHTSKFEQFTSKSYHYNNKYESLLNKKVWSASQWYKCLTTLVKEFDSKESMKSDDAYIYKYVLESPYIT